MIHITIHHVHIAADTTEILKKLDQLIEASGSPDVQARIDAAAAALKQQTDAEAAVVAAHQPKE